MGTYILKTVCQKCEIQFHKYTYILKLKWHFFSAEYVTKQSAGAHICLVYVLDEANNLTEWEGRNCLLDISEDDTF